MSDHSFSRWPRWRRWFGQRSERAAAKFLRRLGYRIIAYNLADKRGEIDLVALDGCTLVIVEVRSTASRDLHEVAASVDDEKQRRITLATVRFLKRHGLLERIAVRFDVLALSWSNDTTQPHVLHIPNAFEAVGKFQFHY